MERQVRVRRWRVQEARWRQQQQQEEEEEEEEQEEEEVVALGLRSQSGK